MDKKLEEYNKNRVENIENNTKYLLFFANASDLNCENECCISINYLKRTFDNTSIAGYETEIRTIQVMKILVSIEFSAVKN